MLSTSLGGGARLAARVPRLLPRSTQTPSTHSCTWSPRITSTRRRPRVSAVVFDGPRPRTGDRS